MLNVKYIKSFYDLQNFKYGLFLLEPFKIGQGSTFGNILRRILLTDLLYYTITNIRINNINHNLKIIPGLKEDYTTLIFNLNNIIFKPLNLYLSLYNTKTIGYLYAKGPNILLSNSIKFNQNYFTILTPKTYIGTLINKTDFYCEFDLENKTNLYFFEKIKPTSFDFITNENFNLIVKRVSFKIKTIYDIRGKVRESLFLEIWTDNSILPQRCLLNSLQKLINISTNLSQILTNSDIIIKP